MTKTLNKIKKHVHGGIQTETIAETYAYLSDVLYEKDKVTYDHSTRVTYYAATMGKELGLSDCDMEALVIGSFLHDIGKITIPNGVLNKEGSLTDKEWKFMKFHPVLSAKLLQTTGCSENIVSIALYHHERYDGAGYPRGLKGEEIPFLARIVTVADSYDAMTTARAYSDIQSREKALKELSAYAGKQFDPHLVKVFTQIIRFPSLALHAV